MKDKFYFYNDDDEFCYSEEYILDKMRYDKITEKEVFAARIEKGADAMYCNYHGVVGEKGFCGKDCQEYEPRNGISGNCIHNRSVYGRFEKVTFKINVNGKN